MGGGYYDRDVGSTSSSGGGFDYSSYTTTADRVFSSRRSVDDSVKPERDIVTSCEEPVVIALDVTGSMGNDAKIIYDKLPMMYGQIMTQGYLKAPEISFAAIGDVFSDSAPLQICDFASGDKLDELIGKIWLEGGGGGQHYESYEMCAFYYLNKCQLLNPQRPFMFIIGDEGFYKTIAKKDLVSTFAYNTQVSSHNSVDIMRDLMEKFNLFHIHRKYGWDGNTIDVQIYDQWCDAIGSERVVILDDAKAIVDVILGIIATQSCSRDIDSYIVDMKNRGQTVHRLDVVRQALQNLPDSDTSSLATISSTNIANVADGGVKRRRSSGTTIVSR